MKNTIILLILFAACLKGYSRDVPDTAVVPFSTIPIFYASNHDSDRIIGLVSLGNGLWANKTFWNIDLKRDRLRLVDTASMLAPLWTAVNNRQATFTLTTTGTTGPASFSSGVLNIPQYSAGGSSTNLDSTNVPALHSQPYYDVRYLAPINVLQGYYTAGVLNVANGGTGTATPGIIAGSNIVVSGTWPNQIVSASSSSGLTNPMTTAGDIIVAVTAGAPTRLPVGPNGQYLSVHLGALNYSAIPAADLPLFSSSAAGAVTASGGGTANFLRADGSWASPGSGAAFPTQQVDATTGTSVTISNQTGNIWVIKNPATLVASYSILFPVTPVDGQRMWITFGGTIGSGTVVTSLSFSGNGKTIIQGPTTPTSVSAGETIEYQYTASNSTWYRIL